MKVELAGYNIDAHLIEKIKKDIPLTIKEKLALTPEVISAAYARVSRSSKSVDELVEESTNDTESARRSVFNILNMGHHSIADHTIFNFNIMEVSRLMVEAIEKRRIGVGYTEKSQRYVTLQGDYVRPKEFSQEDLAKFEKLIALQNKFYFDTNEKLFEYLKEKNKDKINKLEGKAREDFLRLLEGSAKEDARYSLSLATMTQLGCSYTGQALELAIRENKYGELEEQKEFARKIAAPVKEVAPSLIALADDALFENIYPGQKLDDDSFKYAEKNLKNLAKKVFYDLKNWKYLEEIPPAEFFLENDVTLMNCSDQDTNVITALLFKNSKKNIKECYAMARSLINRGKDEEFIKEALKYLSEHDKVPREFEVGNLNYQIIMSASAFAQWKRHRMMTLLFQDYDPESGYVIPPNILEIGIASKLIEVCNISSDLYYKFKPRYGKAAEYCLTNAHCRGTFTSINERELYHISRTREDKHAQWEIRSIANSISRLAKIVIPASTLLLGGKHEFKEIRKKIYEE